MFVAITTTTGARSPRGKISATPSILEGQDVTLIDNDTQDDIIDLVVFGFTLAIIVGVLGYVIGRFRR